MNPRHIILADDATPASPLGGKARALAALRPAGLPIPPWFVVTPDACHDSLTAAQSAALQSGTAGRCAIIEQVRLAPDIAVEICAALAQLCPQGELVAVRSSASDEDGAQHSFAGQLDSFLFVPPADVPRRIAEVWRSGFSERILAYRHEHGLMPSPPPPAVLIQRMVNAAAAGVAFGADPVTGRRSVAVVSAVFGLGSLLVSGEGNADTWHVDRAGVVIDRAIAPKQTMHRAAPGSPEGVELVPVIPTQATQPALTDDQVRAVASLARQAGQHFGRPQDIEWAIESGKLWLLQSRPITSLAQVADPDGAYNLWDNSNIAESYNGVTTPLTFSFARRAYEEVYREFCRILRVPPAKIDASDDIFRHMLGLIRGRVYYNLLSWYRALALLPGFTFNRRFMEQMMGVKEGLPDSIAAELTRATWRDRLRDAWNFFGTLRALISEHRHLGRTIDRFYRRLGDALGSRRPDLEPMRLDELAAYYRHLESQLLTRWDAPLINDFLCMIFYGVLRKLTAKWCGDTTGSLQNDLLCGAGGMISAEPAARVRRLAELARAEPGLPDLLCDAPIADIEAALDQAPRFRDEYHAYLDKFGDRCTEELKLESATLYDDPLMLLRSVGDLARRPLEEARPNIEADLRRRAEDKTSAALRGHPLRRILFNWVLRNARDRVRDRENLRFERTRLFGRVRLIFVEMGRKLHALDLLDAPRDIFYLDLNEILGFVDGTATCTDLKGLAALREAEFERYRQSDPPADRFETHGPVHQGNPFTGKPMLPLTDGDHRQGLGCCPGIVRGPARVITDPRGARLAKGDILVAERTDPGWIMLFPAAAGLLVERGSLLSHSAIVAREMAIPAIVSIPDVMRWLKDGDLVELDGTTGIVRRLESEPTHA